MSLRLPQGFRATGVYSGVKRNDTKLDLSLIVSDRPAVAAGAPLADVDGSLLVSAVDGQARAGIEARVNVQGR